MVYYRSIMHKQNTPSTGFTIVELLIVIVVIAILATISVVAYTGIQGRANNAIVEADAANVAKKMELAKVDLGRYPVQYSEFPDGLKFSRSSYDTSTSNVYYCLNRNTDQYALGLVSKGGKRYIVNSGRVSEVPSAYATAVCDAVGQTGEVQMRTESHSLAIMGPSPNGTLTGAGPFDP